MALERSITKNLESWYAEPQRKALMVAGARQVGKTYSVREFAAAHYRIVLEINFAETPSAKAIFNGDLDAETLIANLTAFSQMPLVPGETLVFLDEIQECPNARAAMKFLVEDGRFDYIESGSLLGVLYKNVPSLPVGYEHAIRMFPLTLQELFRALGVQDETLALVEECFTGRNPVPPAIHERLVRLTRLYFAVGGMPDAVERFVQTSDLAQVMSIQKGITGLYRQDISKYASNKPHVKSIFDAIPGELSARNKRFVLTDLAPTARMERYASDFMWLADAGVALPCYNTRALERPLAINEQHSLFKLFLCDVGLLGSMFEEPVQRELVMGDPSVNEGSILENMAAQELSANGFHLRYFDKSKYGEIDFAVTVGDSVVPVEMKSGSDYTKHKALDNVMAVSEWGIGEGIVFCRENVSRNGRVTYLPWYMLPFLRPLEPVSFVVDDWRNEA